MCAALGPVDSPKVKLLYDIYHMQVMEDGRKTGTGSCEKILNTTLLRSWLGKNSLLRKRLPSRECERAVVQPFFSHLPGNTVHAPTCRAA